MDFTLGHGLVGLGASYAAVQIPMVAGLIRARAAIRHYMASPLVAAPLAVIAGLGTSAAAAGLAHWGVAAHGVAELAMGAGLSAYLGYLGGVSAAEHPPPPQHRRGALVETAKRPTAARARTGAAQLTLAGAAIARADETKHFKLIGTTGTGKSTAIRELLATALARGDRAVFADPDGGYLDRFYDAGRGDVILNPFDTRSAKWNPFAEIRQPYDVDQLARSLIPDQGGSDRSWRGYARTFFGAVTRQAHEAGITDPGELYRLLVVAEAGELRSLVRGTPAQPFLDEHNSRMFDSIRSVTSSAVGALEYVATQKGTDFSVRSWASDTAPGVLFMPYKAGQIAALGSTISAWMRLAIFETMNREDGPRRETGDAPRATWFVMDELDALGQIDGLKDALARLRKFDGRCVLGFQSIAQVSSTYGPGDAHTIVENCGNTLILRCSASEGGGTARFASQLIGEREVVRTTVSTTRRPAEVLGSVSHSEQYGVEAAVLPSQIEQLPDLAGYLKHASSPQWQRVRLDAVHAWEEGAARRRVGAERPGSVREGLTR